MRTARAPRGDGRTRAGCSLGSSGGHTPAPPGVVATPLSHHRGDGIAFSYPAAWSHHRHGVDTLDTEGIIDLSTQPMVKPCQAVGSGGSCGWPLQVLHPGGVFVVWTTGVEMSLGVPSAQP